MVVANDNNDPGDGTAAAAGAMLDLNSFVLDDDVMMITDDHEIIMDDGQLLIWVRDRNFQKREHPFLPTPHDSWW